MIIVGNGSSILDCENGEKIDSFTEVVRFNNYAIRPLWTGTKTTHWWNTVDYKNKNHENLCKEYEECCIHSWDFKPTSKIWQTQKKIIRAKKVFKSEEKWINELKSFSSQNYYPWSTGAIAIWHYLKTRDFVTITGFDWWDREKHHAFDNAPRGNLHNPKEEKILIDKLFKGGRIKFL